MSDLTLYKTSQEFESLIELLERDVLEDWEEERIKERLSNAIKNEGKDIVKYYVNEMADIESLKNEIERLKIIKSSKEAKVKTFKERLSKNMRQLNVKKIATPLGNITLALDGVDKKVELKEGMDISQVPQEYLRTKIELNKVEAKKALLNGIKINGLEIIETPTNVRFALGKESKDFIAEAGE